MKYNITEDTLETQLTYWKEKLSGYQPLLLPTDYSRPSEADYGHACYGYILNKDISYQLRLLSQQYGMSLNSIILSSMSILLGKYSGQDDIVLGNVNANDQLKMEGLIDAYASTQVSRVLLNNSQTFVELMQQVQQNLIADQLHGDLPFEKLTDELGIARGASRHPVFQVLLVVHSYDTSHKKTVLQKNSLKPYQLDAYKVEKLDLSIFIDESEDELEVQIHYATCLFHQDTIKRFLQHYTHLLLQVAESPTKLYNTFTLLSPVEKNQIIYEWNATDKFYPKDQSIYELFEEQVKRTPHNIALVCNGKELTYKELNEKSNQLAHHIRAQYELKTNLPLPPDTLIALFLNKSLEMVIGILAVMKAGGAYVPVDPNYPQDRIDYIIKDTQAAFILSSNHLRVDNYIRLPQDLIIYIDLNEKLYEEANTANISRYSHSEHLAYVIYTSGTTGRPKGVMVEHQAFSQFIYNFNDYLSEVIHVAERNVLSLTNYVFDIFGLEYALPLIAGAKVTLSSIDDLKEAYFLTNQIIQQTPSTLFSLVHQYPDKLSGITCLVGGEALLPLVAKKLVNSFYKVINVYGPAETVIWSSAFEIKNPDQPYIGKPLFNEQLYVLDAHKQPVSIGVTGELYIGGAGLSRGYLNRSELTEERFIENPFATEADKSKGYTRLYKTGDLVRLLADGNVAYIGRNDDQVKIRGYRIELGEIEHAMSQINGIQQVCVLSKERKTETNSDKYLIGYYVLNESGILNNGEYFNAPDPLSTEGILKQLSAVLPSYMVPSYLMAMKSFPLTVNGKLDKKALPTPELNFSLDEYVPASSEIEKEACEIWQEALGLNKIGIANDFFKLGGNSILAIQVSHRMSKAFGFDIKAAYFFKYKTISKILNYSADKIQIDIPKTTINESVLSFSQERLWFIEQYEEGTNAYHMPVVYELDVATDKEGIKHALQQIVSRHEVLRSTIEQHKEQKTGIQKVHHQPLVIEEIVLGDTENYHAIIKEEINRPFDLSTQYPIRVKLYTIQSSSGNLLSKRLLLINSHHIANDGWSIAIFQNELLSYYEAYINKIKDFTLPVLEIQYKDYAQWQKNYLTGDVLEKQLLYWKEKLAGYQALELPTDYIRPITKDYKGSLENFSLQKELSQKLLSLAQQNGVTLHSVMLSSITILLSKYSGQADIVIGSPTANRHHRQTEALIGFFVNTQANRILLQESQSFEALIKQVHQEQTQTQLHQDLPFEKVVDELGVERDTSRHPIFQVMFSVQRFDNESSLTEKKYLKPYVIENVYEVEKFDLSISIDDGQESFLGQISYTRSLFKKETITALIAHYIQLLNQLVTSPAIAYSKLSLLNAADYKKIIYDWNATDREYPKDKTITELFQQQVARTPANTALVFEGQALSYEELNAKSNQLARQIRKFYSQHTHTDLKADTLITICVERSLEMVVSILAVLKAGAAYVPIDPNYPQERIDYILEDTASQVILTQRSLQLNQNKDFLKEKILYVDLSEELFKTNERDDLPKASASTDLAYVIYTSGTTGKPKGVMVENRSVTNLFNSIKNSIEVAHENDRILSVVNFAFDAFVNDWTKSLLNGATLFFTKNTLSNDDFISFVNENKITQTVFPAALLKAITPSKFPFLKKIISMGDANDKNVFENWINHACIINGYGPTEYTVCTTLHQYKEGDSNKNIGKSMDNSRLYLLDPAMQPVPVGVLGELYIGGAGLSRGYLNRPDLTAARFVNNPFATAADQQQGYTRLYKTGDVMRWLSDGSLEFVGRNDDQVKIRGYRIELGEIENALSEVPGIKQCCVLAKERKTESGSTKYLLAYYVLESDAQALTSAVIQDRLALVLPDYMLPAAFVAMDSFPITMNGKLDKRALPEPLLSSSVSEYSAPTTELESKLCEIWKSVLGLDKVGITDNFFRVGGDSIQSIQVSGRIRQAGFSCQVKDIFEYKTIATLAKYLSTTRDKAIIKAEDGLLAGAVELLPIQQWFVEKVERGELTKPNHWNQSFLIRVDAIDLAKLKSVINDLVSYHDVLRMQYVKEYNSITGKYNWKQVYRSGMEVPEIKSINVSEHTPAQLQQVLTNWQSDFDLELGILFQPGYLHGYEDGSARIYLALHHMIVDTVSWRILTQDMKNLYEGKKLPPKASSYRQWVDSTKKYTEQHPTEADYWQSQVKDLSTYLLENDQEKEHTTSFELSKTLTKFLLQQAPKAYHTQVNDLLLTALAYALKEIDQQDIQNITLEGHGREEIDPAIDHSRTVGWFTTLFPVKLELQADLKESIQAVKEQLRRIPAKGIGFGAFATSPGTAYTYKNLPPVIFNYLGQFDASHSEWKIVSEDSGLDVHPENKDQHLININCMVRNGKLWFSVVTKLGELTTKHLGDSLNRYTTTILNHCHEKIEKQESSYTPSDFSTVRIHQSVLDQLTATAKVNQQEITHIYPATSLQQGFIYHVLSQSQDDAYRVQLLLDYHHQLDVDNYIKAWNQCILQYPILRTAFNWQQEIIQIVYKQGQLDYSLHDISHLSSQQQRDTAIEAIQIQDRKQGFDLAKPTLFRLHIIKQAADYYTVLKTEHHSISDGWSGPLLLQNLQLYYQKFKANKKVNIKEDTAYLLTQEYIHKHRGTIQQYWKANLAEVDSANDINSLLDKAMDLSNYKQQEKTVNTSLEISGELYKQLKKFTQAEGITLNVIVHFIWHKLLQVYSNSSKTIVGTTISGRDLPIDGIEESVGLYINTLPLIINWENDNSILLQLQHIQKKVTELNTHSFAELAKLQKNGERIFHSLLIYENYPIAKEQEDNLKISVRDIIEKVDYPLSILAAEDNAHLEIKLQHDGSYLSAHRAKQHLFTLERIIQQLIENPGKPHNQIVLLDPQEYKKIIYDWNATHHQYPKDKTITELFQQQVVKTPASIALVFEGQALSYEELNAKSNQLAHQIRKFYSLRINNDLKADTLIAICMERSLEMVVSILAVLKAGAAYVPIDPNYPQERIDYILEDTASQVILSQRSLQQNHNRKFPDEKILYADLSEELFKTNERDNLSKHSASTDLAYVIYTSGTTGKPKGVMIENHSVLNYVNNVSKVLLPEIRNVDFSTNIAFDLTVTTTICSLLLGKKIFIYSGELSNAELYVLHLINNKIDFIKSTPSLLFNLSLDNFNDYKIKQAFIGGEKLEDFQFNQISKFVTIQIDEYGPTETTVGATSINKSLYTNKGIGKPYFNYKVYILDHDRNPVPVGVLGELYIGGAGLSRGYLNRPDLTAARFVNNPFATAADQQQGYTRLYKTGDVMRWLSDGSLEFVGRNDDQVKIRGYRIELGEIENALSEVPGIKQCCVLAKERKTESGSTKYLLAYYVLESDAQALTSAVIQDRLALVLPDYMLPAAFVAMDSFPITMNGKLDKRALPEPLLSSSVSEYSAPTTELESKLCEIWKSVLGLDKVGITDNFFRVGGDSIQSIQVSGRIRQAGFSCQVKDIFEYKTIATLAKYLSTTRDKAIIKAEDGLLAGAVELLPIQQWFVEKVERGELTKPNHWNQSFLIRVDAIDLAKLKSVINDLVSYHDVLRMQYVKEYNSITGKYNWKQVYRSGMEVPEIKSINVSEHTPAQLQQVLTNWQSDFDLELGILFQPGYLHGYEDGSARIYLALHHMIVDTVSWRILTQDMKNLYEGKKLPPKASSYRQWVDSTKKYTEQHPTEADYWQSQVKDLSTYLLENDQEKEHTTSFELSKTLTKFLLQQAPKAYHTQVNDLLLTALAYALKEIDQQDIQNITLEGHGREEIDPAIDHSRTVGWFTTLFPVKLELQADLKESIQAVKEQLRRIPAKGIGFGAFATSPGTAYTYKNLPPVIFNYLGQFDASHSEWKIVSEDSGLDVHPENKDQHLININCMVRNGKLWFSVVTKLGELTTKHLGDSLNRYTTTILNHCHEKIEKQESSYTPSDFSTVRIHQSVLDQLTATAKVNQQEITHIYPATSLQQGFIYHVLSQSQDDAYRVQLLLDYHHQLDVDNYIKAWNQCILQYPILRTAFNWQQEIIQIVYKQGQLDYSLHDISHLSSQQQRDTAIEAIQIQDRKQGFDLAKPTLFRLHIIKQAADYYTVLKTEHHSISDGWSGPLLLQNLQLYYQKFKANKKVNIKEDTAYLLTQEYIHKHRGTIQQYWKANLAEVDSANDINSLLDKAMDLSNYKQQEKTVNTSLEISGELYKQLKKFTQAEGITLNVIVHFIWHKLLQVYSNSSKTIVGTTISGRDLPIDGIEESVGLYINTLPLIINWENDNSILLQLQHIQKKVTELNTHSFAELAKLQKNGERIFHSLLIYENYPIAKEQEDNLKISVRDIIEKVDYPLSILAAEDNAHLEIKLQHDGSYLSAHRAKQHLFTLERIIQQLIENPGKPHNQIVLLDPQEYKKIIYDWNATHHQYPKDKTITELFQQQVVKTPANTALVFEGQALSYEELNAKSNQLAHQIRKFYRQHTHTDLKADTLIAICMERSLEMVVSILAVLKAGAAYVPIDPNYPQERIDYILEDTASQVILSQRSLQQNHNRTFPDEKILYADLSEELFKTNERDNLSKHSASTDLAYVIYTSGTTGKPKGVMVEHKAFSQFICNFNDYLLKEINVIQKNVVCLTNYVFDIFGLEYALPLITGYKITLSSIKDITTEDILDNQIIQQTPSTLIHLANDHSKDLSGVTCLVGGEALSSSIAEKLISKFRNVINVYGPAETVIWSSAYKIKNPNEPYIGKPLLNEQLYVLGTGRVPVPTGVVGELYIGGAGLGRGYLNRPALTAERFITNPFASEADKSKGYVRLYKTGDLVRWLENGNLEYIGRNDDQIKLRGYRIELGEIEHALSKIKGIKQACVLAKERKKNTADNDKYLVGYYICDNIAEPLTSAIIQKELSQVLPEYMIPGVLVSMESFPLTVNGKLDKHALPDPDFSTLAEAYVAPTTETGTVLCKIWEDVLGLDRVGTTDDFFRIGGNSIQAIRASHLMSEALSCNVNVTDILNSRTISKLENILSQNLKEESAPLGENWEILM